MKRKINYEKNLERDLVLITISVFCAIALVHFGILESMIITIRDFHLVSSFTAGLFFTSVFTIAPASVAIAHLSHSIDPLTLALWGAFGAMIGDLVIFAFVRDVFSEDIKGTIRASRFKKILSKTHFGFLRWFGPLVGALIIISPLPDEIGLSLMGVAKMKVIYLVPLTFVLNFMAIFLIVYTTGIFGL